MHSPLPTSLPSLGPVPHSAALHYTTTPHTAAKRPALQASTRGEFLRFKVPINALEASCCQVPDEGEQARQPLNHDLQASSVGGMDEEGEAKRDELKRRKGSQGGRGEERGGEGRGGEVTGGPGGGERKGEGRGEERKGKEGTRRQVLDPP